MHDIVRIICMTVLRLMIDMCIFSLLNFAPIDVFKYLCTAG